jgi:hypothetical protein
VKSGVAPRRARRPAGKARRPRIPGVFERGATQPPGMHRPSNAVRLSPRAVSRHSGTTTCRLPPTSRAVLPERARPPARPARARPATIAGWTQDDNQGRRPFVRPIDRSIRNPGPQPGKSPLRVLVSKELPYLSLFFTSVETVPRRTAPANADAQRHPPCASLHLPRAPTGAAGLLPRVLTRLLPR